MPGPRNPKHETRLPVRAGSKTSPVEQVFLVGLRSMLRSHGIHDWTDELALDARDWMRLVGSRYRQARLRR